MIPFIDINKDLIESQAGWVSAELCIVFYIMHRIKIVNFPAT